MSKRADIKTEGVAGARAPAPVQRAERTSATEAVKAVTSPQAIKAVEKVNPVVEAPAVGTLSALQLTDEASRRSLGLLIERVDRGELTGEEAWREALALSLRSALSLPEPVIEQLLPQLEALAASSVPELRALRERLGLTDPQR